jgi:N-acetyl-S-(2-succino)cysteine monooxygenase
VSPSASMMKLAAFSFPPGAHVAAWRLPEAAPDSDMSMSIYVEIAQAAERGKMDAIFFQDSNASSQTTALRSRPRAQYSRCVTIEPLMLLPALAMCTRNLGLIATATTTYNHPYLVARHFASIDHISGGRAGWNLVTSQNEDEAGNFGLDQHIAHAERYERAAEFYDVVTGLWDSWDADAFIRDKASGCYYDVDKVAMLNHHGRNFKVRGPLNVARSPQGWPVVAQAGSSDVGRELAARTADIVFTAQVALGEAQAFRSDVRRRAGKYGRSPDHIKIMPGIIPYIGGTVQEAEDKFAQLQDLITDELALRALARHTGGVDLSKYPIDGPLPDLPESNSAKGRQQMLIDAARREGLSIRQLGVRFAAGSGHRIVLGTYKSIADDMERWFIEGAADGFTLMFPYHTKPVHDFVEQVIPELQRRGLFRKEYEGPTLRDNLGVPKPVRSPRRNAAE